MSPPSCRKVLVLSANPLDTKVLRVSAEVSQIEDELERSRDRSLFELRVKGAAKPEDLQHAILNFHPHVVHFSGHGHGASGLAFENEQGKKQLVSADALSELFKLVADEVECVVLNACYSAMQADAIARHISYVIGMSRDIGDAAAIAFAAGFYRALGSGESYPSAFKFARNAIHLHGFTLVGTPEHWTPVLRSQIEATVESAASPGQGIESSTVEPLINEESISASGEGDLEIPEGQVPLHSRLYVERPPIETDCYAEILKPGALIRIKAPRQMGKSSLMRRILHHGESEDHGYRTVELSFQEAEGSFFGNLDEFLQWFCASITDALGLPDELDGYWKKRLGSVKSASNYFERYLLQQLDRPLVLGLDEVDRIFEYQPIAKDFFNMLRVWHEKGKNAALWKKLRLVITHSKEVYIPLDINQSPFNVGMPVDLPMFTRDQVNDLAITHGLSLGDRLDALTDFLGGHPYLVRVALYQFAQKRLTWAQFVELAPTQGGPYSDHLTRHLQNLHGNGALRAAMQQAIATNLPVLVGVAEAFKLYSMGLVRFQGNAVEPLCELYRQYFRSHLGGKR